MTRLHSLAVAFQDAWDAALNFAEAALFFCFGNMLKVFSAAAFLVNLLAPLYIGALWGGFLPTLEQHHALLRLSEWNKHPSALIALIVWWLALVWLHYSRTYSIEIGAERKVIYRELLYLHRDAGLQRSPQADVRCTIWLVPENDIRKNLGTGQYDVPARLVQWADYVPTQSEYQKDGRTRYRLNGKAGRSFRVYWGRADRVYVGILGKTLLAGIERNQFVTGKDTVPNGTLLADYLVQELNYRRRHAKSVTNDRKSFLAIALIEGKKPLGAVYFASREPTFFSDAVEGRILQGLLRLVEAISAHAS